MTSLYYNRIMCRYWKSIERRYECKGWYCRWIERRPRISVHRPSRSKILARIIWTYKSKQCRRSFVIRRMSDVSIMINDMDAFRFVSSVVNYIRSRPPPSYLVNLLKALGIRRKLDKIQATEYWMFITSWRRLRRVWCYYILF